MRLALNIFRARWGAWIQMFEGLNFNFSAPILIFCKLKPLTQSMPSQSTPEACRFTPRWHAL